MRRFPARAWAGASGGQDAGAPARRGLDPGPCGGCDRHRIVVAADDEPVKTYKAGDTFYEPSGSVHRVARNPSGKTRTRLLAVILHSRDTKETTVPEKGKE